MSLRVAPPPLEARGRSPGALWFRHGGFSCTAETLRRANARRLSGGSSPRSCRRFTSRRPCRRNTGWATGVTGVPPRVPPRLRFLLRATLCAAPAHTPLEAQLRHDPPVRLVLVKNGTAVRAKAGNARFCGRRAPTPPSPVAPPPTASASRNRSVVHKSHPASASASASHLAQPLGSVKVAIITDEAGDEARKVKPY